MINTTARLADVSARIAAAVQAAKRDPTSVHLVAVTKTFGAEDIVPVLDAGHRIFGENRVQEAKAKWPALRERYPGIELHLIGPLQSNKAKEAVQLFDAIHSIDRRKIAEAIAEEMPKQGKRLQLFIQVNTGEEPQKAGVIPRETGDFLRLCRDDMKLAISGLMCIPPVDEEAGVHFAFLAKIARELGLSQLSMGMSADFETAIAFGATHIRVGSQIFGERAASEPSAD
jgi:pyridoxal phosphate enzyme (YggS family)